jgi:hypothetical protein
LALVNFMQPVDWVVNWWTHLDSGDKGTWFGGLATFVTLAVTLIISLVTALHQRSRLVNVREAEQDAATRAHAQKFSCWVAGRIKTYNGDLGVQATELVVTLANASEQPFTEAVVEVTLRGAQAPEEAPERRRFTISVVPPGRSWFAFDSNGKEPETLLLAIWFLDNGVRSWTRSSVGELKKSTKEKRLDQSRDATPVSLHHGDPAEFPGLDDPWLNPPYNPAARPLLSKH